MSDWTKDREWLEWVDCVYADQFRKRLVSIVRDMGEKVATLVGLWDEASTRLDVLESVAGAELIDDILKRVIKLEKHPLKTRHLPTSLVSEVDSVEKDIEAILKRLKALEGLHYDDGRGHLVSAEDREQDAKDMAARGENGRKKVPTELDPLTQVCAQEAVEEAKRVEDDDQAWTQEQADAEADEAGAAIDEAPADAVIRILGITVEPGTLMECSRCHQWVETVQEGLVPGRIDDHHTQELPCPICDDCHTDWRPHLTIDRVLAAARVRGEAFGVRCQEGAYDYQAWHQRRDPETECERCGHSYEDAYDCYAVNADPLDALNAAVIAWDAGKGE